MFDDTFRFPHPPNQRTHHNDSTVGLSQKSKYKPEATTVQAPSTYATTTEL